MTRPAGWTIRRAYSVSGLTSREVFVAPDGTDYERCSPEHADVTFTSSTRGLPALTLRRRDWRRQNLTRSTAKETTQ